MIEYPVPLLGFCAWSGTGKTTLLKQLLPLLRQQGLAIGVVKHAHHSFDIDHPGKDSYELRTAGAEQVLERALAAGGTPLPGSRCTRSGARGRLQAGATAQDRTAQEHTGKAAALPP